MVTVTSASLYFASKALRQIDQLNDIVANHQMDINWMQSAWDYEMTRAMDAIQRVTNSIDDLTLEYVRFYELLQRLWDVLGLNL